MDPRRFFVPSYSYMMMPYNIQRPGILRGIFNGIKGVNWGNVLNNANKTLNVVNQTIPLVRQAGPMFSNMRSMLHLAKAFGNETTSNKQTNKIVKKENPIIQKETINNQKDELPSFFI